MFVLAEYLINQTIGFSCSFFIYSILKNLLVIRNHILVKIITLIAFWYISMAVIFPNEITGVIFLLLSFLCCIFAFFHGWWLKKISIALLLYPLMVSINYITEDIGLLIWKSIPNMSIYGQTILHTTTLFIRAVFWFFLWRFFKKLFTSLSRELTGHMWLIIDAINVTSFVSIITVVYFSPQNTFITYPVCLACLITGIGGIYLVAYISRSLKAELEIQNLKYQQSYYEELEQNQKMIRKLRHDMKNHLNLIGTFLKNKEIDQANLYFQQLSLELDTNIYNFCSNSIVNAVLNSKYNFAVQNKIDCLFQIDLKDNLKIDDISLCSLFSNVIDNAIEANQKISDHTKRYLSVKARYDKGFFCCEVSNAKENKVVVLQEQYITEKKDKALHGLGLQNIKDIVSRYQGNLNISYTDTEFLVTIII